MVNPIYGHSPHPAGTMFGYDEATEQYIVVAVNTEGILSSQTDPTSSYKIANMDTAASPKYYGYITAGGPWYIMQENSGVFTYAKGASAYSTAWTNRASQSYDTFDVTF